MTDHYKEYIDKNDMTAYYVKSVEKTQQQIMLESLLKLKIHKKKIKNIADLACGAGTLSMHLKKIYKDARFMLMDYSKKAITLAMKINAGTDGFEYCVGNIDKVPYNDNSFDLVFCWQTLLIMEDPEKAVAEMLRICKPGGAVFISSLFNTECDVDLETKITDHTKLFGETCYRTWCTKTVEKWFKNRYELIDFKAFDKITYDGRGLGTHTTETKDNCFLQISGGMLMNWGFLIIYK